MTALLSICSTLHFILFTSHSRSHSADL